MLSGVWLIQSAVSANANSTTFQYSNCETNEDVKERPAIFTHYKGNQSTTPLCMMITHNVAHINWISKQPSDVIYPTTRQLLFRSWRDFSSQTRRFRMLCLEARFTRILGFRASKIFTSPFVRSLLYQSRVVPHMHFTTQFCMVLCKFIACPKISRANINLD